MKKIIMQIGEKMHVLMIRLRKLAYFKFKDHFLQFAKKISTLAILGA
jgi:hypothetical protein